MIPCEEIFEVFGIEAVVTPPHAEHAIETSVVWSTYLTEELPDGRTAQRKEPRRVASLKRSEVPDAPRGTRIVAAEQLGGEPKTWRVEGTERVDVDIVRVIVVEEPEAWA